MARCASIGSASSRLNRFADGDQMHLSPDGWTDQPAGLARSSQAYASYRSSLSFARSRTCRKGAICLHAVDRHRDHHLGTERPVRPQSRAGSGPSLTTWQVSSTLVGTVIGAGFASGQELYQFFAIHGARGILAAGVSVLVLAGGLYAFWRQVHSDPGSYLAEPVIIGLVALSLPIMLAGGGATLQQQLGWPSYVGEWLLAVAAIAILWKGLRGLTAANQFFVPLISLCFGLAAVAAALGWATRPAERVVSSGMSPNGLGSSGLGGALSGIQGTVLIPTAGGLDQGVRRRLLGGWLQNLWVYAAYNGLLAVPVIAALARSQRSAGRSGGQIRRGICLGGAYLAVLAVVGTGLLLWPQPTLDAGATPIPLLGRMEAIHPSLGWFYGLALLVEMWNTAVAALFTSADFLSRRARWPYRLSLVAVTAGALLISPLGFASLVGSIYPVLGYLATAWFLALVWTRSPRRPRPAGTGR